jgi:two-component system, NtrC family, response regulator AtoC
MAGPSVLVVDDEPSIRNVLRTMLEVEGFQVDAAEDGTSTLDRLRGGASPQLMILDVAMPGLDGLQTLEQVRQISPGTKVVMLSCISDTRKVVQAMHLGAEDYLTKPFQQRDLVDVLHRCLANGVESKKDVGDEVIDLNDNTCFVCASPAMRKIRSQASLVARCDIPVLLLGESGSGKEVVATLIHKLSPRATRPFLKVNCAAVPAELLESELFGYEPGAFTGAVKSKPGKFELCNKGTILLDEIGEMPPALQAKLLHVLQDNEFSRLGARATTKVDVRILAATNIDVKEAIADKRLRPDLYYRLNGLQLRVPSLRERREEIPILLKHFLTRAAESFGRAAPPVSPRLMQACMSYAWPGNLRELQNMVKRYIVLADEELAISELSSNAQYASQAALSAGASGLKAMVRSVKNEAEAVAISEALQQTNWNRKQAAKQLGISYKALLYKIRELNVQPPIDTSA